MIPVLRAGRERCLTPAKFPLGQIRNFALVLPGYPPDIAVLSLWPNTYADDTRGKRVISSYIPLYQMARDVKGTASRGKKESQVSFRALHFLGFRTVSLPLFPPIPLLYVPTRHYNCDITLLPFVSSMYVLGQTGRFCL